ncbi:hypothetical protein LXL04_028406 [Taraxacum kok-saghyz]
MFAMNLMPMMSFELGAESEEQSVNAEIGEGCGFRMWGATTGFEASMATKGDLSVFPRLYALESDKICAVEDRCGKEVAEWPRRRSIRDEAEREEETQMGAIVSNMALNSTKAFQHHGLEGD